MSYHKLLQKQIARYLPDDLQAEPAMARLLEVVSESYRALERDRELAERAFTISEDEYVQLNNRLQHELDVKKLSVEKLTEAVSTISGADIQYDADDLLGIARLLNQQVSKRKNAEEVFTSLIANMRSGVVLEDEQQQVVFINQVFCDLFGIDTPPQQLSGTHGQVLTDRINQQAKAPHVVSRDMANTLANRWLVQGYMLELATGKTYQRDYIPIYIDDAYKGHLWSYTDITERKANQDALVQSELKNRLIMNAALDAIVTIDTEGLITFWNPQAEKIFGWAAADVIGRKIAEVIIPPTHRAAHEAGMANYRTTGIGDVLGKQMELPAINRAGDLFPIELYIIPVNQGDDTFFCSFIRDISARKKAETELERLSLVASANKNGVVLVGRDGRIFWSNEGFCRLTAYDNDEIIGRTPMELCRGPFSDREALKTMVNSFEKGIPFDIEGIHYRKDGSWFWGRTEGQPVADEAGTVTHYFSIIEDISAEKVAQRKLKEYEERLRMALTNVGDNYWEHDFRTGRTYFSNPSNNLLGYQLDKHIDVAGLWWSRVHPDDRRLLEENDRQYKLGLISHHHNEYRIIHRDESVHWVLDRGVVTEKDGDNKPLKIIGTHIDITRQKELELELTKAKDAAEELARVKELFLANMSHEIRTPMNAIMGMANRLSKTSLHPDQQYYLSIIQSATDNLLIIINDILDLSKIEAGKLTLEKIGFEPKQVIDRAMQVMVHKAEEKGLLFTNAFFDPRIAPVLLGDPYRLNQILLNLLSNAIKFTQKGHVNVSCHLLKGSRNQQLIELTVSDSGIGMDEAFTKRIFQTFRQEDESVTRRFGGTGLGLSISHNLVELMGGTMQVKSKKGVGTSVSFQVPFPKGDPDKLPVKEAEVTDTDRLLGKRILVADDNEMNRLVASTMLSSYGAIIEEAQNGVDALDKLKQQAFDLVLMDIQMPVMDGVEATRIIRADISAQLPVIALTAFAVKGDSAKFIGAGLSDYLAKPFSEEQLLAIVVRWLEKAEAALLPAAAPEPPLYDLSTVMNLAKGNQAFVDRMVDLFMRYGPESVQEIRAAYAAGQFEQVRKVAHRVKPSIDNMGISSLTADIRAIEANAETWQTSPELETLIDKLDRVMNVVVEQLKARA
ncbi:multi-sensor hybrid histidine kinase [Fibrella aestuarina BUZ 2]|uniref:Sensory/regulatory protein RpfC n=1 Tax=Fibrella aestuarina BUZ 2 TaxID=1166018 RepID=I0KF55_9BACT|nr:PAS domain S-box protein [Fibrella aestuarina]CCH02758.1 multi-sensor hybrid histidine kinase [Fibrella aestuarina BUZ 2]